MTAESQGKPAPVLLRRSLPARCVQVLLRRTVLVLVLTFSLAAGLVLWHQMRLQKRLVDASTLAEAERYSQALATFRTLYTKDVVQTVRRQNIEVTHNFDEGENRGKAIPLPATFSMRLGKALAQSQSGGFTRLYSDYPFPYPQRKGLQDKFARDAWRALRENPGEPFYRQEVVDGVHSLRYATADLMRASCVDCHNHHPQSPRRDWKVGQVRGVLEVTIPLQIAKQQVAANLRESFFLLGVLSVLGVATLALVLGRLRQTNQELDRRVQKRTAELAALNEALAESNVELQQFAYIASHDLQTPLRAIAGFARLLQQDYENKLDDHANQYIQQIVEGCRRMKTLIDDLLAYSRVESRAALFQMVDLNEVFDDARTLLRASIEEAGAIVTRDELPTLAGDRGQLSQLLQNLIGNAVKYHGDQPPQVHVQAERSGDHWTIAVRDNGIGIAAQHHQRIFEIFRRLHSHDEYPGSGIGLAVCRRIVKRHGGRIWVKSQPGKGSTFYFTIRNRNSR